MNKLFKTAFTLIELLVVIAIIGILSGLIVVSMSGVIDKATIAKAQVFSNSLKNSLMSSLVAEYKLDGNGNDSWGGHAGIINGTPSLSSGCVYGSCYLLNSGHTGDYLSIPDNSVFKFGSKMTAMVWVKGGAQASNDKAIFSHWDTALNKKEWFLGVGNTGYDSIEVYLSADGTGNQLKYYNSSYLVFNNVWHLVGFTWNTGILKLYVDGKEVSVTKNVDNSITTLYDTDINLTVGCTLTSNSSSYYFSGSIDDSMLYSDSISISQIKENYYAGLNKLFISGRITQEEYQQRIAELGSNLAQE